MDELSPPDRGRLHGAADAGRTSWRELMKLGKLMMNVGTWGGASGRSREDVGKRATSTFLTAHKRSGARSRIPRWVMELSRFTRGGQCVRSTRCGNGGQGGNGNYRRSIW